MNIYVVKISPFPGVTHTESVTVAATSFEIVDGAALFYEKRELVAAIRDYTLISKGVPAQTETPKETVVE